MHALHATRRAAAAVLTAFAATLAAPAQDPHGVAHGNDGWLAPAQIHAARTGGPDIPQPPRAINALPQLPDHGTPPVPVGPDNGLAQPADPESSEAGAGGPGAPCSLRFFVNRAVSPSGVSRSTVGEPSAAMARDTAFMTGNWYAALSKDSGMTWSHINPATRFPSVDAGFCCDQRTIYVPSRDMTVWYLQYLYSASTRRGSVRIAIATSRDNLRNNAWHSWVFNPGHFNRPAGEWLDFPDLAYSNSYLYCASNVFNAAGQYQTSIVWRMGLTDLDDGSGLHYTWWTRGGSLGGGSSYRLVQGAGSTMYFASHLSTSSMRVYRIPDATTTVAYNDRSISSWSGGVYAATAPNGQNWAGRLDSRITGAYANSSEYGFLWTIGRGGAGRPQCFTRVARFRTSDNGLIGLTDIWNSTLAFMYPAVATNSLGHAGLTVAVGTANGVGSSHPHNSFRIVDGSCNTSFTGTFIAGHSGTHSPSRWAWGDYFTVARHPTQARTFVATGMSQRGGETNGQQEPRLFWFGLEQEEPTWVNLTVEDSLLFADASVSVAETDLDGRKDGTTTFTRRFAPQQGYTLTAPAVVTSGSARYLFQRWRLRVSPTGSFSDQPLGQRALTVTSIGSADDTALAVYVLETTITIESRNASAVPITVATTDLDGRRDGTTTFTRRYFVSSSGYGFTAPATHDGAPFRRWYVGSLALPIGQRTVTVTPIGSVATVAAEYCDYVAGSYQQYGAGCPGSNGLVPEHFSNSIPDGGTVAVHEVRDFFGATSAAMFLGFSKTTWNGTPLPLSLGFLGADPGCSILAEGFLVLPLAIDAAGTGAMNVPVTDSVSRIGVHTYTQVIGVDPFVSAPLKVIVSNGLDLTIGGSSIGGQKCP